MFSRLKTLLERSLNFIEKIKKRGDSVLLVSHYDADGLSSASIFSWLLSRLSIPFHLTFVEQTYPETLQQLPFSDYSAVVFLDLGSGYKEIIKSHVAEKPTLIIDHHVPSENSEWEWLVEVNPYLVGVDASTQTSSSTLTYAVASAVVNDSDTLIPVAVAGALGDRLDNGEKFSLTGFNREVVEEGKRRGVIEEEISLRLFGLKRKPIAEAIASTLDPYIPGLSGNTSACVKFLQSIGINPQESGSARLVASLTREELRHLASELIKYMINVGVDVKEAEKIFGYNYFNKREPDASPLRDLREYAYILNALGRLDRYGTALALNLGNRGKYVAQAEESIKEYKRLLAKYLSRLLEADKPVKTGKNIIVYIIEDEVPKLTGPISSILASEFSQNLRAAGIKVVGVASTLKDGKYKLSFRRLDEDVNIGVLLQKLAKEIGFVGGGHAAAGGALADERALEELVKRI